MDDHDVTGLERFVRAQDERGTWQRAFDELRAGQKRSHWMWFVFPQVAGLGRSDMARRYALRDLREARAYLDHPILGPRLRACVDALLALDETDPVRILGDIDAMKLRSSMTLFHAAAPDEPRFGEVLARSFGGAPDPATLDRIDHE